MTCIQVFAVLFFMRLPVWQQEKGDSHLSPPPPPPASPDKHPPPLSMMKAYGWYPSFCHWANNASWSLVQ